MRHHQGPLPRRRWITDDMGTRAVYKLCLRCRRWLPATLEHFGPRQIPLADGGTSTVLRSPCRDCHRTETRDWWRRAREVPETLQRVRENDRIGYRLRQKRNGRPVPDVPEEAYRARYGKPWTKRYSMPAEQVAVLAAELERVLERGDTLEQVALRADVPERRIWQVRAHHRASLWTVDRLCLAIGMPLVEVEAAQSEKANGPRESRLTDSTEGR